MHDGRGHPGAQNRLIHPSLPHLLPARLPRDFSGTWCCQNSYKSQCHPALLSARPQTSGEKREFPLSSVNEGNRWGGPVSTQTSWQAAGAWNTGMARDPLCPSPWKVSGHLHHCLLLWRLGWGLTRVGVARWAEGLSQDDRDPGSKLADSHKTPVSGWAGSLDLIWKNLKKGIQVEITSKC